jgi:haloacetate dehalogenase
MASDHANGIENFQAQTVAVGDAEVFVRIGGNGPPLLLLHGFPQTHVCWTRIAPALAKRFKLVLADLTGYGNSHGPRAHEDGANYSKRAVAAQMVAVMSALGHKRFSLAGHDRGARVAYRLALDHPECVERLAVLSILPTFAMWRRLGEVEKAINTFHWFLLAQPAPIPHDLLAGAPGKFVRNTIASWTKSGMLDAFPTEELDAYEAALSRPEVIAAVCAEYRAGWTTDRKHDEMDLTNGRKIACPMLALWGLDEYPEAEMLAAWHEIAHDIAAIGIDCGHFVTEEAPRETTRALLDFFAKAPIES